MKKKLHTNINLVKKSLEALFEWKSLERPWEPKDRAWYVYYSLFFLVFIVLAALTNQYILMILIVSFVFLWFIQGSIPPEEVTHIITNMGIKTYTKLFKWKSIKYYWFSIKGDYTFLHLDIVDKEFTSGNRVHRLSLIIDPNDMSKIFEILNNYIEYGNHEDLSYTILSRALHGRYIDITNFILKSEKEAETESVEEEANS